VPPIHGDHQTRSNHLRSTARGRTTAGPPARTARRRSREGTDEQQTASSCRVPAVQVGPAARRGRRSGAPAAGPAAPRRRADRRAATAERSCRPSEEAHGAYEEHDGQGENDHEVAEPADGVVVGELLQEGHDSAATAEPVSDPSPPITTTMKAKISSESPSRGRRCVVQRGQHAAEPAAAPPITNTPVNDRRTSMRAPSPSAGSRRRPG